MGGRAAGPISLYLTKGETDSRLIPLRLDTSQFHAQISFLNRFVFSKYGVKYDYNVEKLILDNRKWFTATVTDPITKERFSSGLGNIIRAKREKSNALKTPLYQADVKILHGKVFYTSDRLAEHAAAARAIDCHVYHAGYSNNTRNRLCLEDPYSTEHAKQKIDYDDLIKRRN